MKQAVMEPNPSRQPQRGQHARLQPLATTTQSECQWHASRISQTLLDLGESGVNLLSLQG